MPQPIAKITENSTRYTELRANADELLRYVSFASSKDIKTAQSELSTFTQGVRDISYGLNEFLLSNNEPIPLYDEAKKLYENEKKEYKRDNALSTTKYKPFSDNSDKVLKEKIISLFYHSPTIKSNCTSVLSDISALFCSMMPTTEMSLCVPYFDVRLIYPAGSDSVPGLDVLKFVGKTSAGKTFKSKDVESTYGYDVAGMEIFTMPQTIAPTTDSLKTTAAYQLRGVDVLDPIQPLMSIENASIQQIGFGGGLSIQTRVDLKLVLHDRSRLSDIESLVTSSAFPLVKFRITFGWSHPDTNKMTGNVYAKLINSMRVTQDFAVGSVSLGTKDSSSLSVNISLVGAGSHSLNSSKIIGATGKIVPYTALISLIKQYIILKTDPNIRRGKNVDESATFSKVGSTVVTSISTAASSNKFINVDDFYRIYEKLQQEMNDELLNSLVDDLLALPVIDKQPSEEFSKLFDFKQDQSGQIENSILLTNNLFFSEEFKNRINEIAAQNSLAPSQDTNQTTIIPLAEMISHLVAKPLLISQPDIMEVRIHSAAFNSACGEMANEFIGDFPIVKSKFIDYKEADAKEKKINLNTSSNTVINLLLKQVNNPASPFYGLSSDYNAAAEAAKNLRETVTDPEQLQIALQNNSDSLRIKIDDINANILQRKNITLQDTAFIPPRVKIVVEVIPAYANPDERYTSSKKIARIIIYDDRCGDFNKYGNLLFSMINSNGVARLSADAGKENFLSKAENASQLLQTLEKTPEVSDKLNLSQKLPMFTYILENKKRIREIASNLYPTFIIGSEGSLITDASYTSQPGGDLQSGFLLSALIDQDGSALGEGSDSPLIDDVLIIPSSLTVSMLGNTCIARGQTYYVDFNTGTTLDNTYTVTSVTHNISPGSFTTSAIMSPLHSATIKSVERQMQELVKRVKGLNPTPKK